MESVEKTQISIQETTNNNNKLKPTVRIYRYLKRSKTIIENLLDQMSKDEENK
jgi:hypothetical protein